ncbi:unnamed protein product [Diamesa hyperborea]
MFDLLGAPKAQIENKSGPGYSPADHVNETQNRIIAVLARRLLAANLPEDLQPTSVQVLNDAVQGLENCQEAWMLNGILWQYKVCSAFQLRNAQTRLTALENIAANRTTEAPLASE